MKSAKSKKSKPAAAPVVAIQSPPSPRYWLYAVGLFAALFVVFEVYWPAIHGPFLLDDSYMPYAANSTNPALKAWLNGLRPLLMISFWLNFRSSGNQDTFSYHFVNQVLHLCNGAFVLLTVRKIMSWAGTEEKRAWILSIFAAGLFLLHPLQTESVSYVASRSETLSLFWVLAALVVFIYRSGPTVSFARAVAVLVLFGAAVATKEHTAVLPALLLLTDYCWNPGFSLAGIRRNWRLYVPILIGSCPPWRSCCAHSAQAPPPASA